MDIPGSSKAKTSQDGSLQSRKREDENANSKNISSPKNYEKTSKIETSGQIMFLDSEDFDPHEALFNPSINVELPFPDALVFNNLSEYVNKTLGSKAKKANENPEVLKEKAKKLAEDCSAPVVRLAKRKIPEAKETSTNKPKDEDQNISKNTNRRNITVFEKMDSCSIGPYSTLYTSINSRVRVMIRRRKRCPTKNERFSNIDGILLAFDKHFNILLENARESYEHSVPKSKKMIKIVREKGQMMIRGDNVIIVSKL